jgi:hypothetical protein
MNPQYTGIFLVKAGASNPTDTNRVPTRYRPTTFLSQQSLGHFTSFYMFNARYISMQFTFRFPSLFIGMQKFHHHVLLWDSIMSRPVGDAFLGNTRGRNGVFMARLLKKKRDTFTI